MTPGRRSSSCEEAADLLAGPTRFRKLPGARHSAFRDAPEAYEDLRLFLDDLQAGADEL